MKSLICLLAIILSFNIQAQISRSEAVDIVISEIIAPDSVYHLYSKYEKLLFNDSLFLDNFMGYYICPFDENWVFFIDDMPLAHWAHPCRIVFMNASNTEYEIIEEQSPPYPFHTDYTTFLTQWEWILGTGINPDPDNEEFFAIYPNPFRDQLKIDIETEFKPSLQYQLFDSKGCVLFSGKIEGQRILSTKELKTDIYFLTISEEGKTLIHKKLVKIH